ncbi:MAG: iron-containing alcohol dehydrogenase [Treponema sp.]|uniref:iron-containing alcohol dehydrogenase n=1 Tax=Treponema sp. TaxID=166 RepID=UPI002A912D9B|nr:iron-containing alcohol dehydrogenase [Treponema sp.]MDY6396680.1 iron-containing alcohol dehydrogenase [Treponema sp.]
MADFSFKVSPNILLGSYVASRIGSSVLSYGTKFMVIVDPILRENGTAEKITKALDDKKIDYFIFDEFSKGGDSETLGRCLKLAREAHVHGIIAMGGGKPISVARGVCALYNEIHDLYDFLDGATPKTSPLPLICIPTTIRDAFVFTDSIPLVDARSSTLKLLKAQAGIAKLVLFDPTLTATLTENQLDSMSLETLCIATESYLSQRENFFSDMIAEKSIELFSFALDGSQTLTVTTPKEELLSQAGCMASLSAATSSIGIASLLAMCINARYKISRSLVATILFPYMVEECAKFKADRIAYLAKKMNIAQPEQSDEEAARAFAENIRQRIAKANLPARLKDLSISLEQLALAAEDAGQLDIVNNLPRSMNSDDLFGLIKTAF